MKIINNVIGIFKRRDIEITMGIALILCGALEWHNEAMESNIDGPEGFFAIILLGIFVISKSLAFSLEGIEKISRTENEKDEEEGRQSKLKRIMDTKFLQLLLSIALIIAGIGEMVESIEVEQSITQGFEVWHFGMILLGVFNLLNVLSEIGGSLFHLRFAMKRLNENSGSRMKLLEKRIMFLENPKVELVISIGVIGFAAFDSIILGFQDDYGSKSGLMIHSVYNISRFFRKTALSAEIMEDIIDEDD